MSVDAAKSAIESCQFSSRDLIKDALAKVRFTPRQSPSFVGAEADRTGSHHINVFQNAQGFHILRELGIMMYNAGTPAELRCWVGKWALPEPDHVDVFCTRVRDGQYGTFRDLVTSSQNPVCRLVLLNLSNSFIANGMPIADARNIDVRTWGHTAEYASGKRCHSMIPLLSAYCRRDLIGCSPENFGNAFALAIENRISLFSSHSAVTSAFVKVIDSVTALLCEELIKE